MNRKALDGASPHELAQVVDRLPMRSSARGFCGCCGLLAFAAFAVACGTEPTSSHTSPSLAEGGPRTIEPPDAGSDADPPTGGGGADGGATATQVDAGPSTSDAGSGTDGATRTDAAPSGGPDGPQACGFSACAPGAPCPDLVVDKDDLLGSIVVDTRTFTATDCAVNEGCIMQPGKRRLLHFDTGTENVGTADVEVGDPTRNACFTYSQCHQHYHFKGVGKYTLYQQDGTTVAAVGHKEGFCLEDVRTVPNANPPAPDPPNMYTCTNQGLHVGWEDIYPNDIDCQWIDITGVAPGPYVLSVWINPDELLPESDYGNNEVRVPVTVPAP